MVSERPYDRHAHRTLYWDWDPDSDAMSWSGRTEHLFSASTAAPATRTAWLAMVHPDDRAAAEAALRPVVTAQRMRADTEYRVRRHGGGWARVADHAFAIRHPSARLPRVIGALSVPGERIRSPRLTSQQRLEQTRSRFKTFVEFLPLLAWEADPDGWIFYYNQRWFDYTGTTMESMEGWGWVDVHDPDDLARTLKVFRNALSTGQPWEDEFRLRRADGAMRWHLSRAFPLRDGSGRIIRWFGTNTDVHDQRMALQERERLLRTEKQLRREAEVANRQKDQFLAVVSHELRSPLNAILGWTQLLQDGLIEPDAIASSVDRIESNGRMLARLIEDLLDVSRIVSGKLEIQKSPVDLLAAIAAARETVAPEAARREVEIAVDVPDRPLVVEGSLERLQQVMWNLLNNAVKFSKAGQRVAVEAADDGGTAVVVVRDHGEGIDAELLPRLFTRFRQGDSSNRRRHGGLGLGLSIARHLVELHGGTIEAASDGPGQGAVFTVRLPTAEVGRRLAAPHPAAAEPVSLVGIKVLAVDDEVDARDVITSTLLKRGATVTAVSSVAEALEALRLDRPDVVVSDLSMAETDGYGLIERLRGGQDRRWANLPVIALTAAASVQDRARALDAGFTSYVTKPFDGHTLSMLILDLARAHILRGP